jgi:hypothetical protein
MALRWYQPAGPMYIVFCRLYPPPPGLVVLNKLVKTFWKKSNLKFGLIQTQQLH